MRLSRLAVLFEWMHQRRYRGAELANLGCKKKSEARDKSTEVSCSSFCEVFLHRIKSKSGTCMNAHPASRALR